VVTSVQFMGVGALGGESTPVLVLRELERERRWLAIWIGVPEAQELLAAEAGAPEPRPGTITLLGNVISAFDRQVERVEVTELRGSTFYADLVFGDGLRVSARPSDAIAFALRAELEVEVADEVLAVAGFHLSGEAVEASPTDGEALAADPEVLRASESEQESRLEEFREFLQHASPEDFR
jgi:bifunctional DNase/RNase